MSLPVITPEQAKRLIDDGATLIDIRDADEHARESIPGAINRPIKVLSPIPNQEKPIVFHCKSGNRTAMNAGKLAAASQCKAYIIEGGLEAWKKAGLPVTLDQARPIELQRQVQIVVGMVVLSGVTLAATIAPPFAAISAFAGAGLIFAGVTGWCGMAKLLQRMPWNQHTKISA